MPRQAQKKKPYSRSTPRKRLLSSRKAKLAAIVLLFGLLGVSAYLYQTFAATVQVSYKGYFSPNDLHDTYRITTGTGDLKVSLKVYSSRLGVTIKNSTGAVVATMNGVPSQTASFAVPVTPGTYSVSVVAMTSISKWHAYQLGFSYPVKDSVAPVTLITKPLDTSTVLKGTVPFAANVTDQDTGVAKVEFYADNKLLKTDYTAPYDTTWNTTTVMDGQHTLQVKSFDKEGNVGTASATVTVKNAGDMPKPENPTSGSRFPGDPNPRVTGKAYWGSGINGNGDPKARVENEVGKSLSIRRTFWGWDHVANLSSSMYRTVRDDHANNRLPFVSFKTPGWKALASGKYDAQLDAMLRELDKSGKPVWLVAHHEPDSGGGAPYPDLPTDGIAGWKDMQKHIRGRMTAIGTKNIAFMPVLMSWTFAPASGRNIEDWWVPGIWDAFIVDHYIAKEETTSVANDIWNRYVAWAEAKGIPMGVAEWGNRGTNATAASEMKGFWEWGFKNKKDMIAYAYFDSGLNSPDGSWVLTGEPWYTFKDILKNDTRVKRINL